MSEEDTGNNNIFYLPTYTILLKERGGGVEGLPSSYEALGLISSIQKSKQTVSVYII